MQHNKQDHSHVHRSRNLAREFNLWESCIITHRILLLVHLFVSLPANSSGGVCMKYEVKFAFDCEVFERT